MDMRRAGNAAGQAARVAVGIGGQPEIDPMRIGDLPEFHRGEKCLLPAAKGIELPDQIGKPSGSATRIGVETR
jgi:hypothetical protein